MCLQRTIQDLFEVEAGSGEKVEEFVVLHQEPSASEAISPRVARPYIQALHSINLDAQEEEQEEQKKKKEEAEEQKDRAKEEQAGKEAKEEDEEAEGRAEEEPAHREELNAVMEQVEAASTTTSTTTDNNLFLSVDSLIVFVSAHSDRTLRPALPGISARQR